MSAVQYTKEDIIADMKLLIKQHGTVTREIHRGTGHIPEYAWKKFFPTFKDFVKAASIETVQYTEEAVKETVKQELHDDKWDFTLVSRIKSLDELVKQFEVDLSVWAVERFVANSWEMGFKDKDGDAKTQPLYQVKATFIKKQNIVAAKQEIELLKAESKVFAKIPKSIIYPHTQTGNVLELTLPDLHAGGLAWSKETGGPDWDTKIAADTFNKAIDVLLDRSRGYKFDRIVLVTGGDLLNSDDLESRTTKGTTVTSDTRFKKTFVMVRKMLTECIEKLRLISPVTVITIPGNHDELASWTIGDSLESYFHNYPDVTVDNSPAYRKYFRWGQTLLLFTHGDTGKRSDYPLLMATEQGKAFGDTKFHEIHTGHFHQTQVQEFHGVRVRILPSLKSADDWHAKNMFVGQQREAVAFVFNKEQGMLAQFVYNADV
jgi:hypothetical protein